MPSSLVFTALVVSWLAVLVPVVARRRQLVPRPAEADLCSRVLRRSGRASTLKEVDVSHHVSEGRGRSGGGATALAERDEPLSEPTGATSLAARDEARPEPTGATSLRGRDEALREPTGATPLRARGRAEQREDPEVDDHVVDDPADDRDLLDDRDLDDLDDDRDLDDRDLDDRDLDDRDLDDRDLDDDLDDDRDLDDGDGRWVAGPTREPKPYRPGRGGFDAEAARAAAEARFAVRRRVALALIAVTVVAGLVALVVTSAAWWVVGITVVGLAGYLVFLRHQTRLEEELRERRIARLHGLRRAEDARRERLDAPADEDDLDLDDRDLDDDLDDGDREPDDADGPRVRVVAEPRWAAPRSPAPPIPAGMELVGDSDDDPAFHDLAADRVPAYRRAAGA